MAPTYDVVITGSAEASSRASEPKTQIGREGAKPSRIVRLSPENLAI